MRSSQWRLQDAKTQFSQVVDAALRGEPQHITHSGKQAVVVLSEEAFESLLRSTYSAAPGFIAHLLAIPRHENLEDDVDVEQASLALRDVDFS
ncbi:MAG: type II toxin-antitoxin system Phd/YefM family antitoxin [Nitrosospira sp.]